MSYKMIVYSILLLEISVVILVTWLYYTPTSDKELLIEENDDEAILRYDEAMRAYYQNVSVNSSNSKTILFWNVPQGLYYPTYVDGKCGVCNIVTDRSFASKSDAVVVYFMNTHILPHPKTRNPDQAYVWLCKESPWLTLKKHNLKSLKRFDYYFNATMTYRRDSRIDFSFLEVMSRHKENPRSRFLPFYSQSIQEILGRKRHLALWLTGNCDNTFGALRRYNYVKKLVQEGLEVHVYGRCFDNEWKFPPKRSVEANKVMAFYKFYLAFENAYRCRDYITEKFWENAIYSGVVPVVLGVPVEDLKKHAPPNSYIDAELYVNNPRRLVEYLNHLHADDDKYVQFFHWRTELQVIDEAVQESNVILKDEETNYMELMQTRTLGFCDLCQALHTGRYKTFKPIPSLEEWWYGTENKACLKGEGSNHTKKSRRLFVKAQRSAFSYLRSLPQHTKEKAKYPHWDNEYGFYHY